MEKAKATPLFILLAASLAATAVFASVFVYYPVQIQASPAAPPVIFSEGSNANQRDLGSNTIAVTISQASTSLSVTVHPTYQVTYYKDIAVIKNTDNSNPYYIAFRVNTPASDSNLQSAYLIVKDSSGNTVQTVDLKTTGTSGWVSLNAGQHYSLDLSITYSAGSNTYDKVPGSGSGFTASIQLIYSTTNSEAAP